LADDEDEQAAVERARWGGKQGTKVWNWRWDELYRRMDEVVVPFIGLGKERRGREGGGHRWLSGAPLRPSVTSREKAPGGERGGMGPGEEE
jgi:hypothetical protein